MKRYLILFLCIIIIMCGFKAKPAPPYFSLIGKTIIIDPGHGGLDPGTLYQDIYEKDIVLNISKYLEKELLIEGATVLLTRNDNYDLSKPNANQRKKSDFDNRIKIINNSKADMYLSIHLNYLKETQYFGPQVFHLNNQEMAASFQDTMNIELNSNRKIKNIPATNYMYNKLKIKGLLIECGFLSNPSERKKLVTNNYQQKIAKTIVKSIINYYY